MNDELVSALLPTPGLRAVLAVTSQAARKCAQLHHARPVSATLFAEGLTGAVLLASLQKERSRINLQLECDGALRGFFCDAGTDGTLRGYVKNPNVDVEGAEGPFRWRPAFGNSGFLSILRDLGKGEYYRSSVELQAFDFPKDFERYFAASEQVETFVAMEVLAEGTEPLGTVAGLLLQPLPDGDREALGRLAARLKGGELRRALAAGPKSASLLLGQLLAPEGAHEVMSRYPVELKCSCSRERVLQALASVGAAELEDMAAKEGRAEVTCEFCTTRYVVERPELMELLQGIGPRN